MLIMCNIPTYYQHPSNVRLKDREVFYQPATTPSVVHTVNKQRVRQTKQIPATLVRVITRSGSPREKNLNFGLVWSSRDPSRLFSSSHFWQLFAICRVPIRVHTHLPCLTRWEVHLRDKKSFLSKKVCKMLRVQ